MSTLRERVAAESPQLALWEREGFGRHERRYLEHRRDHPEVFARLVSMARQFKAEGWTHIGIRMLWETLRYRFGPHAKDDLGFGLNDWLTRYYARDLMKEHEDLRGLFEVRERR